MSKYVHNVWRDLEIDNHFWAFYYFCKRQGDIVGVSPQGNGKAHLHVQQRTDNCAKNNNPNGSRVHEPSKATRP